jgi:SAM-dependent methyltransferase
MAEGDSRGDLPPARLRTLVAGTSSRRLFEESGRRAAAGLAEAADEHGFDINDHAVRVLDFGCGSGRTSRHWQRPIYGIDINPRLIRWCQQNLPGDYAVTDPEPPTNYPDQAFDLVYAVSVFTHLTVERQSRWLAEFARIIRPEGLLLLTTHGDRLAAGALTSAQHTDYHAGAIVVCYPRQEGSNICAAYHPTGALGKLTQDFTVLERRVEQVDLHDINVLRRVGP